MSGFGTAVKWLRNERSLTIEGFAVLIHISPHMLMKIEAGEMYPDNFGLYLKKTLALSEEQWTEFIKISRGKDYRTRKRLPYMTRKQRSCYYKLLQSGIEQQEAIKAVLT